jgi:hypothetical protein
MAAVNMKIDHIPPGVSEMRLRELLSTKGRVIVLKMSGSTATVQIESNTIRDTLMRSSTNKIGLVSLLSMDSSGLGELKAATVSLL